MKKTVTVCLFVFTTVCLQAQNLSWDIKLMRGRTRESVPINRTIRMETGEEFVIAIKTASDCFAYVVCYESSSDIIVFHDTQMKEGNEVFIGPLMLIDPPGTETFYVIMSMERQTRLESIISNYNNNPGSAQNADNLRAEIAELQRKASELGEPASAFIASGGTSRGSTEEYATRFSEKDMYVRPIAIRH